MKNYEKGPLHDQSRNVDGHQVASRKASATVMAEVMAAPIPADRQRATAPAFLTMITQLRLRMSIPRVVRLSSMAARVPEPSS